MSALDRIDRRHFAAQLALGASGLGAAMVPLTVAAATEDKSAPGNGEKKSQPTDKKPDEPTAAPELPPAEVLLLTYLTRRYPSDHYDEESLQGIYRDIRGDIARGRQLSEFPLKNADEPAFAFTAYRSQIQGKQQKETEGTK